MNKKRKIVLFGCGNGGKNAFKSLYKEYDVVAFTDNNIRLHGCRFEDTPIISPDDLENIKYDFIFISSMYYEEISNQLTNNLNLNYDKIKFIDKDILMGSKPNIFIELFFALFLMTLVGSIVKIIEPLIK